MDDLTCFISNKLALNYLLYGLIWRALYFYDHNKNNYNPFIIASKIVVTLL